MNIFKPKRKFSLLILIFLLFSFPTLAFSDEKKSSESDLNLNLNENFKKFDSKTEQLKYIQSELSENKIEYSLLNIFNSTDNFCPNIFISFNSQNENFSNNQNDFSDNDFSAKELLFILSQDFFAENTEFVINFLKHSKENKKNYNLSFLLYPNSEQNFLPEDQNIITGIESFEENLYETENLCVIEIRNQNICGNIIETTYKDKISPSWLTRLIKKSCNKASKQIVFPRSFNFIHKFNLSHDNKTIGLFLENDIPGISLGLSNKTEDFKTLENITDNFLNEYDEKWISNYSFFSTPIGDFWSEELFYIGLYVIILIFSLFFLCFIPVIGSSKNKALLKDFFRISYLVPILILFSSLIFFLISNLFFFIKDNSLEVFFIKFFLGFFIILFLLSLQAIFNFKFSFSATNFQMLFVSTLNIIIFGSQNITLISFIILEYFLVLVINQSQNKIINLLALVFQILPFLYIFSEIKLFADPNKINFFSNTNFLKTLELSLLLYPIFIQWQRFILLFHIIDNENQKSLKKNIIASLCSILILEISIFAVYILFSAIFKPKIENLQIYKPKTLVQKTLNSHDFENLENTFSFKYDENSNFGLSTKNLILTSRKNVLRYEIQIKAKKVNPILDCNFPYNLNDDYTCQIILADYPLDELEINFTTENNQNLEIYISSYVQTDDFTVLKETYFLETEGDLLE